jgi:uncharacterized membrane protein YjgN (DUF898 family)
MDVLTQTAAPDGAPSRPDKIAHFLGLERDYWNLVIRGSVLSAVTLGIYRFWFATDVRRFLWSNTEFGGETLEYTGRGLELFLGFLIAIAVLFPIYVGFALLPVYLRPVFAVIFLWLGQFAVYRARRYRLTRTIFRGVRLHQQGSAVNYAFRSFGWWILTGLTLGLAYPWAQANLERYKMRNTFYGDLPGRFANSGTSLFLSGIGLWLVVVGPLLAGLFYLPHMNSLALTQLTGRSQAAGIVGGFLLWSIVAVIVLYPAFEAIVTRWWLSGLRFGDIAVTSFLRTGQIYRIWLRFLIYAVLLALATAILVASLFALFGSIPGFTSAISGLRTPGATISTATAVITVIAFVVTVLIYITFILVFSALYQVMVKLAVWRVAVESLDVANFQMVELVKAEGTLSSPFGEGLADALDVGGV